MIKKILLFSISLLFLTSIFTSVTAYFSEGIESVEIDNDIQNDGVIILLAFPTEFHEYEKNYTFMCPGRGYGLWITPDGI